ncbi:MAG: hypothetical protein IPM96_12680 [Ignavibacteria bacterium]|nr:hypothetical protein [Ignavibacteria bacterium]
MKSGDCFVRKPDSQRNFCGRSEAFSGPFARRNILRVFAREAISGSNTVLEFYNNSSAVRAEIASSEKRGLAKEL